ncbi:hypothetical protein KIW84_012943 [Lathyrus oleraceus]|uniref:DUF7745 domain-containing protein n=1 Tax=Pisum sativum TaxID=3888 RepID=A0A9D5BIW2_PEA|nr:hypothetical protein KIW84_012943 [Pisum sativum]
MERQRRNTKKYSFRQPDLKELRNLISYVLDPLGFKARFGKLLFLLTTQVDEGLMSVLVQFYDPLYRCFTFPDFQLLPTLEEYAYLLGIPILDQFPFSGLESVSTSQEIADMLHIDESLVGAHMTIKGGIQGLNFEFLIAQAIMYGKAMSEDAFEAIFVLLIYGLVLFPNIDKEKRQKGQKAKERRLKEGKAWSAETAGFTQDLVAEKTHSRSGKLDSVHTRMALGNTRMGWLENGGFGAGTRHTRVIRVSLEWYAYGVCYTRMSERDDVLSVKASLLVRV